MKLYTLIASSVLALGLTACSEEEVTVSKEYTRTVKVYTVGSDSNAAAREFSGRVASADVSALSFRIGGEIIALPVRNGLQVKAGDIIARLDDRTVQNDLKNAQAQFELATAEHTRKQSLFRQRIISQSSYDRAYTALVSATTALDQAKDNLSYTEIHAPFDGVIGKVSLENHEVVNPNQVIATIQGEEVVEITIQLPENIVANIAPQEEIEAYRPQVRFTSNPEQAYAVQFKESAAEANRGSQTYDVTYTLDRPDDLQLLPGMSATVVIDVARITRAQASEHLLVPTTAISRAIGQEQTYAWKLDPNASVVNQVQLELGNVTDNGIEVLAGLRQGDQIVSAGLSELSEGMTVTPLAKERGL